MKTKHEIEIEGLPEGWRAVEFRRPKKGDFYLNEVVNIKQAVEDCVSSWVVVEKIKPRRVVMEKTGEEADINLEQEFPCGDTTIYLRSGKIWREVKEE